MTGDVLSVLRAGDQVDEIERRRRLSTRVVVQDQDGSERTLSLGELIELLREAEGWRR